MPSKPKHGFQLRTRERRPTLMLHGTSGMVSINGAADNVHVDALPGETVRLRIINAIAPGMDGGPEAPVLARHTR
jgi:hypothetical protein